jgi:hypothetical protein
MLVSHCPFIILNCASSSDCRFTGMCRSLIVNKSSYVCTSVYSLSNFLFSSPLFSMSPSSPSISSLSSSPPHAASLLHPSRLQLRQDKSTTRRVRQDQGVQPPKNKPTMRCLFVWFRLCGLRLFCVRLFCVSCVFVCDLYVYGVCLACVFWRVSCKVSCKVSCVFRVCLCVVYMCSV